MTLWEGLAIGLGSIIVGVNVVLVLYVLRTSHSTGWATAFHAIDRRVDDVESSVKQLARALTTYQSKTDAELRSIRTALELHEERRREDTALIIDAVTKTNQAVGHLAGMVRRLLPEGVA